VVYEGALSDLRRQGGAGYMLRTSDDARARELVERHAGVTGVLADEHGLRFEADEQHVAALSVSLGRAGVGILSLTPELATLEDLFFRLTGDGHRPAPGPDQLPSSHGEQERLVSSG